MNNKNTPELTEEKSTQQAQIIELIKPYLSMLDYDYCKALVLEMRGQASRQDAMSVLSRSYNPKSGQRLRVQADALNHLAELKRLMIESTSIGNEIESEADARRKIDAMFL